eukprot:2499512-Rhodomonas_salina.2
MVSSDSQMLSMPGSCPHSSSFSFREQQQLLLLRQQRARTRHVDLDANVHVIGECECFLPHLRSEVLHENGNADPSRLQRRDCDAAVALAC